MYAGSGIFSPSSQVSPKDREFSLYSKMGKRKEEIYLDSSFILWAMSPQEKKEKVLIEVTGFGLGLPGLLLSKVPVLRTHINISLLAI